MDINKNKTVTFSTDYSLGPQICHYPDTIGTAPSPDPQIRHSLDTTSVTHGSNSQISHVPETPEFRHMPSGSFSYQTPPQPFRDVQTDPLAASTPANTNEQPQWHPLSLDESNESYFSEGPLESTYSSLSLEPLWVHTQSPPQMCTPLAGQIDNVFNSSLLLPGSLRQQQVSYPNALYNQTSPHLASEQANIQNTALMQNSQPTQDSGIHMGTPVEASFSQGTFNHTVADSSDSLQQLQQQLHYVHTELHKIAKLQLQQQILTREQLLILPPEHYGSYTDISRSTQIPTTVDVTNKAVISSRPTHTAKPSSSFFSGSTRATF